MNNRSNPDGAIETMQKPIRSFLGKSHSIRPISYGTKNELKFENEIKRRAGRQIYSVEICACDGNLILS